MGAVAPKFLLEIKPKLLSMYFIEKKMERGKKSLEILVSPPSPFISFLFNFLPLEVRGERGATTSL